MDALKFYDIPLKSIKNGIHQFNYPIENEFFSLFEGSVIQDGKLAVHLNFEKRSSLLVLDFSFEGTIPVECDRCLMDFDMPVSGKHQLIVKFSEEEKEDEDDIIFINPKLIDFNIAQYIYEIIHLGIPIRKACEEEDDGLPSCGNETVIKMLYQDSEEEEAEDAPTNSTWDILKDLKTN